MRKKKRASNDSTHVHYDGKSDALYIAMKSGMEEDFIEIAPGIHVELNRKKQIIGIEILNASQFLKPVLKPIGRRLEIAAA